MTKKSQDINYISRDLFPKSYRTTMVDDMLQQLQQDNQQLKEQLKVIKKTTNELLTYLDKNKLVLNNQNILDFYINIKEILNKYIGE